MDDFDKFIDEKIFPELEPIEAKRKEKISTFWVVVALIIIIDVISLAITQSIFALFFILVISLIIIAAVSNCIFKRYDAEFSSLAIGNIVKFIDKNLEYARNNHIIPSEYKASSITLYIAIGDYKPFKVPIFDTVFNKEIYYHYLKQLKFATGIVEDFNLNTRIWTV